MLVDTNVLIDVLQDDPVWADWSISQLRAHSQLHKLAINPVIYAELSMSFTTFEALDKILDDMELDSHDIPRPALFLAGKAYLAYKRSGGTKSNVLSDFFIGAHAVVSRMPLLTRDAARYRSYFPSLRLVCPA
ncbi:MAG: hypothetical protein RL404_2818 [Pseudomonadota bacterium]|jgi:predicted nucleic acid-binding protein